MKVYVGNYDGRRYAMVAARNQKAAAAALGMSLHGFRQFFQGHTPQSAEDELALSMPGVVWGKPMSFGGVWTALHKGQPA